MEVMALPTILDMPLSVEGMMNSEVVPSVSPE
jgi:hypothetical protein